MAEIRGICMAKIKGIYMAEIRGICIGKIREIYMATCSKKDLYGKHKRDFVW